MNQEHQPVEMDERTALLTEIGQELSQARQEKHLSIQEIAHRLKLRKVYIESLESGKWEALPGEAYVIGFLKQYATLLDLDLSDKIKKLSNAEYKLTKPMTFPDPPVAPSKKWALWAGGIFVLLFILFNANQMSHDTKPSPAEKQVSTIDLGKSLPQTPNQQSPEEAMHDETDMLPEQGVPTTARPQKSAESESRQVAVAETNAKPSASQHRYTFSASDQDVWLEVYLPDEHGQRGKKSIYRLLKKGESATIETDSDHVLVSCGRPSSLSISIDGQTVVETGKLAPGKRTVKDLVIHVPGDNGSASRSGLPSGH